VLSEKALVIGWREWIWVEGCDVVVVPAGGVDILTFDLIGAIHASGDAGLIDGFIIPSRIGISHCSNISTIYYQVAAACVRAIEVVNSLLVQALVYGLDSVCIVVGECRIGELLGQKVYTAIDDAQSVKVNYVGIACCIDRAIRDAHILFFEEGGERRPIPTTILR